MDLFRSAWWTQSHGLAHSRLCGSQNFEKLIMFLVLFRFMAILEPPTANSCHCSCCLYSFCCLSMSSSCLLVGNVRTQRVVLACVFVLMWWSWFHWKRGENACVKRELLYSEVVPGVAVLEQKQKDVTVELKLLHWYRHTVGVSTLLRATWRLCCSKHLRLWVNTTKCSWGLLWHIELLLLQPNFFRFFYV